MLASNVISAAKDISKLNQKAFSIINPFTTTCDGSTIDSKAALQRLYQIHQTTLNAAKNELVQEELFVLDELGLFDPEAFSKYMSNAKFKQATQAKIQKMKTLQKDLVTKGVKGTVRTMAQEKSKMLAIAAIDDFTGFNIAQTRLLATQVNTFLKDNFEKTSSQSVAGTIKKMGTDFLKTSAKSLGKGFVVGVIFTVGLESVSYLTGYDLTAFDPFQVFYATPMGDGTISGNITSKISLVLYPDYSQSLEAGFYTNADIFSGKLVLMAMIAESRAKDKSMFSFLDE